MGKSAGHPDRRRGEQFQQRDDAPVGGPGRVAAGDRGPPRRPAAGDPSRHDNDPRRNRGAPIPGPAPSSTGTSSAPTGSRNARTAPGSRRRTGPAGWMPVAGRSRSAWDTHDRRLSGPPPASWGDVAYVHGGQFTTGGHGRGGCRGGRRHAARLPGRQGVSHPGRSGGRRDGDEAGPGFTPSATGHPERSRIVSQSPGYHGNTLGALSVSGREALREPYLPLLAEMPLVPAPWCQRCALGPPLPGVRSRLRRRSRTGRSPATAATSPPCCWNPCWAPRRVASPLPRTTCAWSAE